jgi:acetate kinase
MPRRQSEAEGLPGALVAALGGLDALGFSAGVGQHAVVSRARICDDLAYLGL